MTSYASEHFPTKLLHIIIYYIIHETKASQGSMGRVGSLIGTFTPPLPPPTNPTPGKGSININSGKIPSTDTRDFR